MQNQKITENKAIASTIDGSINQLDKQRAQELSNLIQIQQAKQNILKNEQDRLSKINSNDPRIQSINNRLSYNGQLFSGLDIMTARANIQTTPLPANAWRLQGYVYYKDKGPASGVTVFFVDGNHQWVRSLGNACTNETGYYSVTVDEKVAGSPEMQTIYLSVSDKDKKIVYLDSEPLIVKKGMIIYRDIILSESKNTCVPPPDDNVAESSLP